MPDLFYHLWAYQIVSLSRTPCMAQKDLMRLYGTKWHHSTTCEKQLFAYLFELSTVCNTNVDCCRVFSYEELSSFVHTRSYTCFATDRKATAQHYLSHVFKHLFSIPTASLHISLTIAFLPYIINIIDFHCCISNDRSSQGFSKHKDSIVITQIVQYKIDRS